MLLAVGGNVFKVSSALGGWKINCREWLDSERNFQTNEESSL
jgi:hypothetical protein